MGFISNILVNLYYVFQFFQRKILGVEDRNEEDIIGNNVLITGSNTGMGFTAAEEFAKRGANVILACRNLIEGEKAVNSIKKTTGSENLTLEKLDLGDFESIRNFCNRINKNYEEIHILINNAELKLGTFNPNDVSLKTKEGFELGFGVNYFGHFLMTKLLLNKLKGKSKKPNRVVILSSTMSMFHNLDFDDLMYDKRPDQIALNKKYSYGNSKFANALFARELSKILKGHCNVYALCPGLVRTNILRGVSSRFEYIMKRIKLFLVGLSPKEGVETTLYCALSRKCQNETGMFYRFSKINNQIQNIIKDEDDARLWENTEEIISKL